MAENNTATSEDNGISFFEIPIIIVSSVAVVSNVLLLIAFIKDPLKCFRNTGTYLVMNLSASDCMMGVFSLLFRITPRSNILYPAFTFFIFCLGIVSFVSITSISIDRFLLVTYPIKHRIWFKSKVIVLWIAAIWVVSCVISLYQMFSDFRSASGRRVFYVFSVSLILLSSVMYSSTYYKLKRQSRNIALHNSNGSNGQEIRILKQKRFLRTIVIISCIAFVSIVPYLAFSALHSYLGFLEDNLQAFRVLHVVCITIFFMNFVVNPLIYVLRLPSYRKTFYLIYCRRKAAAN